MSIFLTIFAYLLSLSLGQDCAWNVSGATEPFSLTEARGYHAMCFDTSGGQPGYSYTITACGNYAQCEPGNLVMGTLFDRNTGTCQATTAMWDNGVTQPTLMYMDGQPTFHFKYTNGNSAVCSTFTMNVYWKCDENMQPPFGPASSNTCYEDNECESSMIIPTPYACVQDYNGCNWYLPGAQDIFSLESAQGFQAICFDTSNGIPGYAYTITPCGDFAQCNPGEFSMGTETDTITGQCLAQTTIWDNGATFPIYYDIGAGRRGWKFRYSNGNKPGCETFYMNIDYVCDPNMPPPFGPASSNDCYSISECEAIMHIPTPFACAVGPTLIESLHNASINMHISSLM